jgi:hypothetical protein
MPKMERAINCIVLHGLCRGRPIVLTQLAQYDHFGASPDALAGALIATSTLAIHVQMLKETELAARASPVGLQYLDVLSSDDNID